MKALVLLAVVAAVGALGYTAAPDVRRYLRIRSM